MQKKGNSVQITMFSEVGSKKSRDQDKPRVIRGFAKIAEVHPIGAPAEDHL